MQSEIIYTILGLFIGCLQSLQRRGWIAKMIVISSIPMGGFIGAYSTIAACWMINQFKYSTHLEMDPMLIVAAGGGFGLLMGSLVGPAIALYITRKQSVKNEKV